MSVNVTARIGTAFGLVTVIVSVVGMVLATGLGLKLFVMVGATGAMTVKTALLLAPVPEPTVATGPELLVNVPLAVLVTFTVTLQVLLAAIEPLFSLIPALPAASAVLRLFTNVPPQVLDCTKGVATFIPGAGVVGKVSIKAAEPAVTVAPNVIATALGLVMLMVKVDGVLATILMGLKVFNTTGVLRIIVLSAVLS